MPLARRVPKVGFTNLFRREWQIVNLGSLARVDTERVVDLDALRAAGLIGRLDRPVKLLGNGEVDRALEIRVHGASASAKQKIEAAGGSVEIVAPEKRKAKPAGPVSTDEA